METDYAVSLHLMVMTHERTRKHARVLKVIESQVMPYHIPSPRDPTSTSNMFLQKVVLLWIVNLNHQRCHHKDSVSSFALN